MSRAGLPDDTIGILRILILLFKLYRYLRKYWVRRLLEKNKKKNEPVNQPFCIRRVSGIAVFVEKERVNASSKSVKCQNHSSCGRVGEGKDMLLWIASDTKTKSIPVIQVGLETRKLRIQWCMN
jgi:hypothetical protein